jgi:myosin heavy subunit
MSIYTHTHAFPFSSLSFHRFILSRIQKYFHQPRACTYSHNQSFCAQGHFNEFNFSLEIQEYQRENIQWSYDDFYFQTNTKCIELIEGKRTGMLSLLDEQCIMPNGNDETFCTKLKNDIPDHPHLYTAKMKGSKFTLKHYAAEVVYDAEGFCFKNKDPVQPAIVDLMHSSRSKYVQKLFASHYDKLEQAQNKNKGPRGQSSLIFESVTSQFKRQLADLMLRINAAQPHFVRCINPNSHKTPQKLEPEMILDQLRCSGLMEAVRVSRAGFPVRMPHQDFVNRFALLIAVPPSNDIMQIASKMCTGLRIPSEHYRMGKTKVFMRREINDKLEEERSKLLVKQALTLQRVVRGHLARTFVKYLRVMRQKAAVSMQRMVRRLLVRRWYLDMLDKRKRLLEQQERERRAAAAASGTAVAPAPAAQAAPSASAPVSTPSANRPAQPKPATSTNPSTVAPGTTNQFAQRVIPAGMVSQQVVDELELSLSSVRELYYNERSSQLALSNLVKEIHSLQDPDEILKRIKHLEDKIATQVSAVMCMHHTCTFVCM